MHQGLDLFGQLAVTWPEIYAWVERVAGIPAGSPRAPGYAAAWCVADKIAAAKLRGDWPPAPSGSEQCDR